MVIRIKDWQKFQHFKDRRPPWVKLYRDLLDDIEWHELDPKAAKALVLMWLIASESDGYLPEPKNLAFRLRLTETQTLEVISKLSHWLEQDDIKLISGGYQADALETERETERETETREARFVLPDWVPVVEWNGYQEMRKKLRKPMTDRAKNLLLRELSKLRDQGYEPAAVLDCATAKNWLSVYAPKGEGNRTAAGVAL